MDEELKPCPFCGNAADFESIQGNCDDHRWSVGCNDENCIGYQSIVTYARKQDARKAWNTRAAPSSPVSRLIAGETERSPGKSLNALAADLLRPYLKPGQQVVWREPFRWHNDNGAMPNHYDGQNLEYLSEEFGFKIEWDFYFHHAAIITYPVLCKSEDRPAQDSSHG